MLDLLLETDGTHIDDNALFTDTWGEWWGLLMEAIYRQACDGVRVLLKHGANPDVGRWGDGVPQTPLEAAEGKPEIMALLLEPVRPEYSRKTNPPLPSSVPETDALGRIRDKTGLVFQPYSQNPPTQ